VSEVSDIYTHSYYLTSILFILTEHIKAAVWTHTVSDSDCLQSVVGPSTFLDLRSGMDCPKTLFRRRHFQVSSADLNLSSSSSHIVMLSSNCTFDTIVVVLVVMFIT